MASPDWHASMLVGPDGAGASERKDETEPRSGVVLQRARHPDRRRRAVPSLGLELQPRWAALLMSVSSIIVATNAVLLKSAEHTLPAAAR